MENNKGKIFKKGSKQSGITLVALVVTVVVLLILAGVSIRLVLDNNGIITRAGDAKDKHEQGRVNDQTDLDSAEEWINQMAGGNSGRGSLPFGTGTTPYYPGSDFTQVSGTDLSNGLVIEDGNKNQYVWIEVPKTEAVYGEDNLNITEFSDTELNTIKEKLISYANDYRESMYSDTWYDGCGVSQGKYTTMYNNMLKSVYKNGGFWIGRYEIGDGDATSTNTGRAYESGTEGAPVIKANMIPYNYITCSQAEELAETFAPNGYTSSLMFGIQWDLVCKHLETKGRNPGTKATSLKDAIKSDSTDWGNYTNAKFTVTNTDAKYSEDDGTSWITVEKSGYSKDLGKKVLLTTGATVQNSMMNIYDLAGNLWEWDLEYILAAPGPCSRRGGAYTGSPSGSVSNHSNYGENTSMDFIGARVAIY